MAKWHSKSGKPRSYYKRKRNAKSRSEKAEKKKKKGR